MLINRYGLVAVALSLAPVPASAQTPDALQGKFAFNWHSNPSRQKCVKVEGQLLADFKSAKFRCEMKPISNTASGGSARVCTEVKGGDRQKEYLIFDGLRACESERKTQASNG